MTFVFTFFIIIRRRAIIECALVVIKTEILTPSMWNAVEKKLLLIELEWDSILEVVYINKSTNNT